MEKSFVPAPAQVARALVVLALSAGVGACTELSTSTGSASDELVSESLETRPWAQNTAFTAPPSTDLLRLESLGAYIVGEVGSVEIVAFDAARAQLFVTNANESRVDVITLRDPSRPTRLTQLDLSAHGSAPTSVAVSGETVAIAVPAAVAQDAGSVVFYRATDLAYLNEVRVGALPDMLTFSPDHAKLIVACEGEPSADYRVDPPGEVSIIDLEGDISELDDGDVRHANFANFDGPLSPRLELAGRAALASDVEPEFVAISADSSLAWVSLQENNALARIDLATAQVTQIVALGNTRHPRLAALETPSSSPVMAMRQPDGIASFEAGGREYLITANEGECRSYEGLDETELLRDLDLDPKAFPDAALLQRDEALGRVLVSGLMGDIDDDGDYDELYACGSRSVSVFTAQGALVWDSGSLLDQLTQAAVPAVAQAGADLGPTPEGVVTATLGGKPYAFVGLEQAGGVVVFDLSTPAAPELVVYEPALDDAGPEGLAFVSAEDSPDGEPMLIVANEVSGSVRVFRVASETLTLR